MLFQVMFLCWRYFLVFHSRMYAPLDTPKQPYWTWGSYRGFWHKVQGIKQLNSCLVTIYLKLLRHTSVFKISWSDATYMATCWRSKAEIMVDPTCFDNSCEQVHPVIKHPSLEQIQYSRDAKNNKANGNLSHCLLGQVETCLCQALSSKTTITMVQEKKKHTQITKKHVYSVDWPNPARYSQEVRKTKNSRPYIRTYRYSRQRAEISDLGKHKKWMEAVNNSL